MQKEIELYYWPTPNGWKISIALEELSLPYKVKLVNINEGDQKKQEYKEKLPFGKIPSIIDFDKFGNKILICESGNILIYLATKTKKLYGITAMDKMKINQWVFWQVSNLGPMAGQAHHFIKYAPNFSTPIILPYAQKRYQKQVTILYKILEKNLDENEYIAGDFFSIADVSILPWIAQWKDQKQNIDNFKNLKKWFLKCCERPMVKKGFQLHSDLRYQKVDKDKSEKLLFNI